MEPCNQLLLQNLLPDCYPHSQRRTNRYVACAILKCEILGSTKNALLFHSMGPLNMHTDTQRDATT
eukprot:406576-Amphidinium_carterae.1